MINNISTGLSSDDYARAKDTTRGEELERLLTNVCKNLGDAGSLTENKADLEFLVGIVGSYLISTKKGTLAEEAQPPSKLFDDRLFEILDNAVIDVEVVDDGE